MRVIAIHAMCAYCIMYNGCYNHMVPAALPSWCRCWAFRVTSFAPVRAASSRTARLMAWSLPVVPPGRARADCKGSILSYSPHACYNMHTMTHIASWSRTCNYTSKYMQTLIIPDLTYVYMYLSRLTLLYNNTTGARAAAGIPSPTAPWKNGVRNSCNSTLSANAFIFTCITCAVDNLCNAIKYIFIIHVVQSILDILQR